VLTQPVDGLVRDGGAESVSAALKESELKQIREFAMARCVPFFWSGQESDNRRSCGTTRPSHMSAPASEISR
jgi:hypothetical protein